MQESIREHSSQSELAKTNETFDELFILVDNDSSDIEKEDKIQDIINYLRRVGDANIVRRFLDSKYDQVNRDGRFNAKKRLELKQKISKIKNEFVSSPSGAQQPNIIETKEALPESVTMKLLGGEMERNILGRGKKRLSLKSASNQIAVLNKGEQIDNVLKFSEKTGSILKGGETIEASFFYDTASGCIKIYAKDNYSGEQQLLDTVMLSGRRRNANKVINLPGGGYMNIDFNW